MVINATHVRYFNLMFGYLTKNTRSFVYLYKGYEDIHSPLNLYLFVNEEYALLSWSTDSNSNEYVANYFWNCSITSIPMQVNSLRVINPMHLVNKWSSWLKYNRKYGYDHIIKMVNYLKNFMV